VRRDDAGSAVVEFVTLGVLLLVPVVYLVIALGRVQAGAFAAEGAAREAARVFSAAPDQPTAERHAHAAVRLALHDQGFREVDPAQALAVHCEQDPCLQPQAQVRVRVQVDVVLPGVPRFIDVLVPTRVPVRAEAVAVVDRFRG
jgi:Flp pilus assembly protein TadG